MFIKQGAEVKQHSNFPLEDMVDKMQSTALATFLFPSRDGTESSTHHKTLTEKNQHITISQSSLFTVSSYDYTSTMVIVTIIKDYF